MISVVPIGKGLVAYLARKAREDYYFNGGEPPGKWLESELTAQLDLTGTVKHKTLQKLTLGFSPAGEKLVQNAGKLEGKYGRHMGMSYVFSADKNFSIEWAFATPSRRIELQAAFDRAVERTVREYIEPEVARARLADGSETTVKIAAAQFNHATSRSGDMHYHAHVLFPSVGLCPDGHTRALVSKHFYDHKLAAGAYFRVALEHECRHLGLEFTRPLNAKGEEKSYSVVKGVPEEISRHFAKRRQEIDARLDDKGLSSPLASLMATLLTRKRKETTPSRSELFQKWTAEAAEEKFSLDWVHRPRQPLPEVNQSQEYALALQRAIAKCTDHHAHFQKKDIVQETLVAAQGRGGVDPFRILTYLNRDLSDSSQFVSLGIRNKVQRFTIPEILRMETQMCEDVRLMAEATFIPLPEKIVQQETTRQRSFSAAQAKSPAGKQSNVPAAAVGTYVLDPEQQACVRYATQAAGLIKPIFGPAGSSKSTVAAAIADAYRKAGWRVYGAALAGSAAKALAEKTGIECDTVQLTLMRLYPDLTQLAKYHLGQMWRAASGQPTQRFDQLKLDAKSVLFVDEASMVGTRDFALLTGACQRAGAVMIPMGDCRQLSAISQGGAFASILGIAKGFELTQIKRQEHEKDRERVRQLAEGDTEEVLQAYAAEGKLHVAQDHAQAQEKLVKDWTKRGGIHAPQKHVILAPTNVEAQQLNDLAQLKRLHAGALSTRATLAIGEETLLVGDRILFTKKSRKLRVENGDTGVLVAIHKKFLTTSIQVQFDGEIAPRTVVLKSPHQHEYQGLTRGYALTIHKMQGRSVDHAYCHLAGDMTDRELTYVALSRHRKSVRIYTDENHAGVALTNLAREATREGPKIKAKPGLKEDYSPLLKQAGKTRAKTLAIDELKAAELTMKLEPGE